jgi:hypothetical protein
MTLDQRPGPIVITAVLLLGNFYIIVANAILLLRGHPDQVPLPLVTGRLTSIIGYVIFFGVFSVIFFFPLKNLHTYVRDETRSAMAAFVISLLLILVGAVAVTYLEVETDVLFYLEGKHPEGGGGGGFGALYIFCYVPIALLIGACVERFARIISRD